MSTNEEPRETSSDAAGTPAAPTPAAPPAAPSSANTPRSQSRFYSRMGRGAQSGPAKPAAPTIPAEGFTPEEAVNLNLKDNLPVRATMGDISEFAPSDDRGESPRDRGDRGGRGERRERRGRDRDRSEGRERGPRRQRERDFEARPPENAEPTAAVENAVPEETQPAAPLADSIPPKQETEDRPRRLRFEDAAPEHQTTRRVQEFRPSQSRSRRDEETSESPAEPTSGSAKSRGPGLLGWMKSIFSGSEGSAETTGDVPAPSTPAGRPNRGPRVPRGPRSGSHKQGQGSAPRQGEDDGAGGKRRRRRRRGGRNRRPQGESQGGAGGGE